ncbi:MAG: CBS domain-containing protein [Cyclobacteriaceae bacterium]
MGDFNVRLVNNQQELNDFTKCLLNDIHALERMLEEGWFESDTIHIGAEQELCLVDEHLKPAPKAMEVLSRVDDDSFVTELAKFNLETNLNPQPLGKDCFTNLHQEIDARLTQLEGICKSLGIDYALTGILPTIRKFDLEMSNMTPLQRYEALLQAISNAKGKNHELRISGLDELHLKRTSAMLEACNTSFQVHLQIKPEEFVKMYNISQVLAAPALAISVNSPLLFGKRLWAETRIALFQQSIDTRITSEHLRERSPRVTFGKDWLHESISEIYKDDIVRFRVMLQTDCEPDNNALLDQGITPKLRALMIHNSTVYRWNRACYGISPSGKPHLRIENRVFPSGPTVVDEVANAAFWIGMMKGMDAEYSDIRDFIEFDHAKDNFFSAARDGLNTSFNWINGKKLSVNRLINEELLPLARHGLELSNVSKAEIDKYMGVIEGRNESRKTGTQWLLNSHVHLLKKVGREEIARALTSSIMQNEKTKKPVHEWPLAEGAIGSNWRPDSLIVEEFMTTDVFTANPDDLPELVADIMAWRKLKYMPIENNKGTLKGLVSYHQILSYLSKKYGNKNTKLNVAVKDIMEANPPTIHPEESVVDALKLMKSHNVNCLPVVKNERLIGIISEGNFINITASLLNSLHKRAIQKEVAPEVKDE